MFVNVIFVAVGQYYMFLNIESILHPNGKLNENLYLHLMKSIDVCKTCMMKEIMRTFNREIFKFYMLDGKMEG